MKKWVIALGIAGAVWMMFLLHLGNYRLAMITNYPGLSIARFIQFKGIAPSPTETRLFNVWLILTSALEWIVIGSLARHIVRRIGGRG